jgi:two-component sensor histidine kinase
LADDSISVRLQTVTSELREIHNLLTKSEEADPRILTDFRDALNRVRNAAWAVEQFANSKMSDTDPKTVMSVLAGERIRVTFQLCKLVQSDLSNSEIKFQMGQLMQLQEATKELVRNLDAAVAG